MCRRGLENVFSFHVYMSSLLPSPIQASCPPIGDSFLFGLFFGAGMGTRHNTCC